MNQYSRGPRSRKAPSWLLWSMATLLPLRLQRHPAAGNPAWRRALQGRTDYFRWGGNWGRKMNVWACGQGCLSLTCLLDDQRMGRMLRCYLGRLQLFRGGFWNLLRGLANWSSLLFGWVQKAFIMPEEIPEPAECVILALALCFPLWLQTKQHLWKWDLTIKTFANCLPRLLVEGK